MSTFHSFTMVKHPRERIWQTLRDHLPVVADLLDDLDSIATLEREQEADGTVVLLNRWQAKQRVPYLLQDAFGTDIIAWLDRARWDDANFLCEWQITPLVLSDHIECHGTTRYEPAMAGRGTRVTFDGSFVVRPGALSQVPAAFESALLGLVENIVSTVIPRNLARAVSCAGRLLSEHADEPKLLSQPSSQA